MALIWPYVADGAQSIDRLGLKAPTDCFHYGAGCDNNLNAVWAVVFISSSSFETTEKRSMKHCIMVNCTDFALSKSVLMTLRYFQGHNSVFPFKVLIRVSQLRRIWWIFFDEQNHSFSVFLLRLVLFSVPKPTVASLADCKCWSLFRCCLINIFVNICLINIFYILHDDLHWAWHVRTGFRNFEPVESCKLRGKGSFTVLNTSQLNVCCSGFTLFSYLWLGFAERWSALNS